MKKLSLFLLVGLCSCTQDTAYRLSELRIPDPEKTFISHNRVDTTFIFIQQEGGGELQFYKTYDENGNILLDSTDFRILIHNYYNSNGFLVKRETRRDGEIWVDSLSYEFEPDSLILRQKWLNRDVEYKFYFDDKGRLWQRVKIDQQETTRVQAERINYIYSRDLLRKCLIYGNDKSKIDIESDFYYSQKGILDSATLKTYNGHRQRWVYDSLGLLNAEWSNSRKGQERFVHKRRE